MRLVANDFDPVPPHNRQAVRVRYFRRNGANHFGEVVPDISVYGASCFGRHGATFLPRVTTIPHPWSEAFPGDKPKRPMSYREGNPNTGFDA